VSNLLILAKNYLLIGEGQIESISDRHGFWWAWTSHFTRFLYSFISVWFLYL